MKWMLFFIGTHFGVRIGLQAGSSCCVNFESVQDSAKKKLCQIDCS